MGETCLSCKENKDLTKEHIIPQALGCRLTARLYCKACNSKFGIGIDKELSKQFGHLATILKVKRTRGKNQPVEVEDIQTKVKLNFDGTKLKRKVPNVIIEAKDGVLNFADITARSEKELNIRINSIKEKLEVPNEFKTICEVHNGPRDLTYHRELDNELLRRAASKVAYSFLCTKVNKETALSSAFDMLREYIKFGNENHMAAANYINTWFMTDYIRPLHKIHISYNRKENILIGFVSFFGTYRFTILLSECFKYPLEWPDLDYTYDPVTRLEVSGKEGFRAPSLKKSEILHPKQSKELVAN